jgi:hypothetical protein
MPSLQAQPAPWLSWDKRISGRWSRGSIAIVSSGFRGIVRQRPIVGVSIASRHTMEPGGSAGKSRSASPVPARVSWGRAGPDGGGTGRPTETERLPWVPVRPDGPTLSESNPAEAPRPPKVNAPAVSPRRQLADELAHSEAELDLARAALLIAREEYPQLPVELYLARLDQVAEEVKDRLANETAPPVVLAELVDTLYTRRLMAGNRSDYYDPRNSFLNDVLDRGVGIPLTLGIVLLETGWRLGLPLEGVNFPGHFLVRFRGAEFALLVDPFDGG